MTKVNQSAPPINKSPMQPQKQTSIDIEKEYGFDYEDLSVMTKNPRLINKREIGNWDYLPVFQRPTKCPNCSCWVLRDFGVVNNRVTCPNELCQLDFCWICADNANDDVFFADHFSDSNMFGCYGDQYKDIRKSSRLCIGAQRFMQSITIPFHFLILTTRHSFDTINEAQERWTLERNILLKILITIGTYLILLPLFLVIQIVKTILLMPFAFLWQLGKVLRVCMRSKRLYGNKQGTCCGVPNVETVKNLDFVIQTQQTGGEYSSLAASEERYCQTQDQSTKDRTKISVDNLIVKQKTAHHSLAQTITQANSHTEQSSPQNQGKSNLNAFDHNFTSVGQNY